MNSVLEEIYSSNMTTTPEGRKVSIGKVSIDRNEAELLHQIIIEEKPRVGLEIGLAYGLSTIAICDGLQQVGSKRHIVIDPYQHHQPLFQGIGLHNLRIAGFDKMIEFHETYSYRALPKLESEGEKIDFAFIDGSHVFDYVLVDFFYIDKMMSEGGIVVFDDAGWPAIRRVIRYIVTNLQYSVHKTLPTEMLTLPLKRIIYDRSVKVGGFILGVMKKIPKLEIPISRAFGGDLLGIDMNFGLKGSCIALKKESGDNRKVDHFIEF